MNDLNIKPAPAPSSDTKAESSAPREDAASALKSAVTADAHDLADKAKNVAGGVVDHARQSVESQISGGKERVAEGLGSVAEAMRHTGEHLRSQDKLGLTEYVARAADQVDAVSDYLQDRDLNAVFRDLGSYARREPALFLGGAFALGLLGGRFLKSSRVQPTGSGLDERGGSPNQNPSGARAGQQKPKRPATLAQGQGNRAANAKTLPGGKSGGPGSLDRPTLPAERPAMGEKPSGGSETPRNGAV